MEENGIVDGEPTGGDVVSTFSFVTSDIEALLKSDVNTPSTKVVKEDNLKVTSELADNRKLKRVMNDKTPVVDAALRHYHNYIFNENGEFH
ncbi:hypothetical protein JHL18_02685 [Clostridium sp. YIM B02505]|uniref:Uncharacterized protein n=1 Tax=Clostridium yunnanense TaxID=2800325 RepID=A0ABS1EJL8_9CLOT|nr:hypothetical protein [Clostridium yunnanense]MBK1809552.1 hypothetical protein [Clostridium yunnanense]